MNNIVYAPHPINWQAFKQCLQKTPLLNLQFRYGEDSYVDHTYHITEIKLANTVSVDCGGKINYWTDIIIQLWEPLINDEVKSMEVGKALSIINTVEASIALNPLGIVKVEFEDTGRSIRQMSPVEFIATDKDLIVNLAPDRAQCKAQYRGERCGEPIAVKQACTPGEGCC